jgi:CheY-like chemotaxis protein
VSTGLEELGEEALQAAFGGQFLPPGLHVTLEVSDTGCGIPAENLSRIFDPFFSTKFAGRGLSLAVAQGVLRGHGAGCSVRSTVGEGSRFKLFFPAAGEAPSGGKAPAGERAPSAGVILLVDDELVLRESLAEILEEAGYTVATAQDGAEAVEYYAAHPGEIALVVMDLTMPRMDGREAFQAIRRLDPAARVVLCSGFSEHDAIRQFQGEGLAGFLSKPFRGAQLRELVGRFVQPKGA